MKTWERNSAGEYQSVWCHRKAVVTDGNYNYCNGHMFLYYRNNRTEGGPDGDDIAYD